MGEEKNKKDSKKHPKNPNNKKIPKALVAEKESSVLKPKNSATMGFFSNSNFSA